MNNTDETEAYSEDDDLKGTTKDIVLILKRTIRLLKDTDTIFETYGKMLSQKFEELDLYIHALDKIPATIDERITATVPIITEGITTKHMEYLDEFKQHINSCNNAIDIIKAKLEGTQYWYYKKTLITIGIGIIVAVLVSISTIYVMFKSNPPKHETRILKANTVQTDGTVHVFDMTGKFCGKITGPQRKNSNLMKSYQ